MTPKHHPFRQQPTASSNQSRKGHAMANISLARKGATRQACKSLLAAGLAAALLLTQAPALAQAPAAGAASAASATASVPVVLTSASAPAAAVPASALPSAGAPVSINPYGLATLWLQGDWVAKACLFLLALMSIASWYVLLSKALELRRLRLQTKQAHGVFGDVRQLAANMAKLGNDNPLRFVAESGSAAAQHYAAVKPRVDYDTWLIRAIEQALSILQSRTQGGMAVLATIGSTAPFVGLFGTVWAIYSALIKIGASGQASIDRVAGPVGEALIMTAIGLAVAVPAVFGYNWLLRQNKLALESVRSFGARLHVMLLATGDLPAPAKPPATQSAAPAAATGPDLAS